MNDTEPKYFTKFKSEIFGKIDHLDNGLKSLNKRMDGHAEQIAQVSEDITVIKEDIKTINKRLDGHTHQIAHISEKVDDLKSDMKRVVFA